MKILAMNASLNAHGNDAKGAFIPQAQRFTKTRTAAGDAVTSVGFDNLIANRVKRRADFLARLHFATTGKGPIDALAYFGHGLRTGLPSAGFTLQTIDALADAIHAVAAPRLVIALYACSTAAANAKDRDRHDGDGGFADVLRDRLSVRGHTGWVDAHTIAGHTTINRFTRRFHMDGSHEGVGGSFIVAPGSALWTKWGAALKLDEGFRFGFPFVDEHVIAETLARR